MRMKGTLVLVAMAMTACAPEAKEAPCAGKSKGELYTCLKTDGQLADIQAAMVQDPEFIDALLARMTEAGTFTGPEGVKGDKGDTGTQCYDATGDANKDGVVDVNDCVGPKGEAGAQGPPGAAPTAAEVGTAILDDAQLADKLLKAMAQYNNGYFKGPQGEKGDDGANGVSPKPKDVALTFINDLDLRAELIDILDQSGLFLGDAGPKGDEGPQGEQGPVGEAGPKGDPGDSPTPEDVAQALVADPTAVEALTGPSGANCWDAVGDANGDGTTDQADCIASLDGVATEELVATATTDALKTALCAPLDNVIAGFSPIDLSEGSMIQGDSVCVANDYTGCTRSYQLLSDGSAIAASCVPGGNGWGANAFVCCQL